MAKGVQPVQAEKVLTAPVGPEAAEAQRQTALLAAQVEMSMQAASSEITQVILLILLPWVM